MRCSRPGQTTAPGSSPSKSPPSKSRSRTRSPPNPILIIPGSSVSNKATSGGKGHFRLRVLDWDRCFHKFALGTSYMYYEFWVRRRRLEALSCIVGDIHAHLCIRIWSLFALSPRGQVQVLTPSPPLSLCLFLPPALSLFLSRTLPSVDGKNQSSGVCSTVLRLAAREKAHRHHMHV